MALFSKSDKSKADKSKPDKNAKNAKHQQADTMVMERPRPPQPAPTSRAPAPAPAPQSQPLSAAQVAQNNAASQRAMSALGEMVTVLMRAEKFQAVTFGAATALLTPALNKGQYAIARGQNKDGVTSPVAACLWARVSPEIDAKLSHDSDKPVQLTAQDWSSGDIPWIVFYVGDKRFINPMLAQLQKDTLKGKPLKIRMSNEKGGSSVKTLTSADLQQTLH